LEEVLTTKEISSFDTIKTYGVSLFSPRKGGSFAVWKERPLKSSLLVYAAEDVKQLFCIYNKWKYATDTANKNVEKITAKRISDSVNAVTKVSSGERDF